MLTAHFSYMLCHNVLGYGTRYTVHGIRYTVYGIRYTVYGTRYTVHGIRYTVYGIRYTKLTYKRNTFVSVEAYCGHNRKIC